MNAKRGKGKTASFFFFHGARSRTFIHPWANRNDSRIRIYTYFNMCIGRCTSKRTRACTVHACMHAGQARQVRGTRYHHIASICLHRSRRGCATSSPFFLNFAFYLLDGIIYRKKNNEIRIIYPPRALPCALRNLLSKFLISTFRFAP